MAKQKSLKLNFIMNIMLTMSNFIFPFITFPYISRVLQPEAYGTVSSAISLINIFSMIAQLGIPTYGVRACAKVRDNKEELTRTSHELLMINLVMNVFVYIALIVSILLVPELREEKTLYLILSATILLTSIGMEWLYKALEEYTYITMRSLIFKVIAFAGMFLLVHEKDDYIIYGALSIFAASASNIFNIINVRKYIDLKPVGGYKFKKHLEAVAVFFAMACATTIYTNLSTVMLKFIATDTEVGYYTAAIKLKTILVSVVTSLGTVLLPRVTYYVENNMMEEFKRVTQKALNFVFLLATPLMVFFILFAKEGILFFSGEEYLPAVPAMQAVMPTLLLIGITNILGIQILVPQGKEIIVLRSEIAGAIVDVIANILLIPMLGCTGAAVGMLFAEIVVLIAQYQELKGQVKEIFKQIHYGRLLVAILLSSVAASWLKILGLGAFISLVLSAVLFFGVYALFLLWRKEALVLEIWNMIIGKATKLLKK